MGGFIVLILFMFVGMAVLTVTEDPEWQVHRHIDRLAKESIKRDRNRRRVSRYTYAGYSVKRR